MDMKTSLSRSKILRSALLFFGVAGIGAAVSNADDLIAKETDTPALSGASCEAIEETEKEEVYFTSCGGFI
jgi:hypothetical protein